MKLPIFMDNHSTTPMDPRVLDAMLPYFVEKFGNAASRNHAFGWEAEEAVEQARKQIAKLIKADLLRVFVMGKNAGWGQDVPEPLRNGNWVYASYLGDGRTKGPEDTATCRACHLPLANKDFVHRYDEHFAARK